MDGRSTTIKEALSEPAKLALVKRKLGLRGTRSRTKLAASLCRQFRFRDPRGKLQVFTCLKALRDLEEEGHFRLPPRQLHIVSHWRARRLAEPVPKPEGITDLPSWIQPVIRGPEWLTGGSFGIEASAIAVLLSVVVGKFSDVLLHAKRVVESCRHSFLAALHGTRCVSVLCRPSSFFCSAP